MNNKQIFKSFQIPKELSAMLKDLSKEYKVRETPLSDSEIIRIAIKNLHRKLILNQKGVKK